MDEEEKEKKEERARRQEEVRNLRRGRENVSRRRGRKKGNKTGSFEDEIEHNDRYKE